MHHLAINGLRRVLAVLPIASAASISHGSEEEEYQRYLCAHLHLRPILTACVVWVVVLLLYWVMVAPAKADEMRGADYPQHQFTPAVCYALVQDAGRMIAWARWEQGFSLEKTRSAPFPEHTPSWMIDLVQDWITDAYQWQATDEQILQWASELGNVQNLPRANQLNSHETIAIWMRHIARQCGARRV
jgi:hypothetical protein